MNSLLDLNGYSSTVIDISDQRLSTVKFDRASWIDQLVNITSTTVAAIPQALEILEIVNYSIANCRFQVSIKSSTNPNFYVGSSINFGTLPSGVTLNSNLGVYTLSGINSRAIWNAIKNPTWTLPANYATNNNFYLQCKVIWYDQALGIDTSIDWDVYDPDFYFIANLVAQSTVSSAIGYLSNNSIQLNAAFACRSRYDAELEAVFRITCRPEGEVNQMSAAITARASMNITARQIKGFGSAMTAITFVESELAQANMVLTIDTTLAAGKTIQLPLLGNQTVPGTNIKVYWGDGTTNTYTSTISANPTHEYATEGIYTIKLQGTFKYFGWSTAPTVSGVRSMFISCATFGTVGLVQINNAFDGCNNFISAPSVLPSTILYAGAAFRDCVNFNDSKITNWNTSNLISISSMFERCSIFNQNLNNWNTTNLELCENMFNECTAFNQPLNAWNTAKLRRTERMFALATSFNQSLNSWNTVSLFSARGMFFGASNYNQPMNNWNTANTQYMSDMFNSALAFDQNISNWEVTHIATKPTGFDTNTSINWTTAEKPQWGV